MLICQRSTCCHGTSQIHGCETWKRKSPLEQTGIEISLDINGHNSKVILEEPGKTVTVASSPEVVVLDDGKWTIVQKQGKRKSYK